MILRGDRKYHDQSISQFRMDYDTGSHEIVVFTDFIPYIDSFVVPPDLSHSGTFWFRLYELEIFFSL